VLIPRFLPRLPLFLLLLLCPLLTLLFPLLPLCCYLLLYARACSFVPRGVTQSFALKAIYESDSSIRISFSQPDPRNTVHQYRQRLRSGSLPTKTRSSALWYQYLQIRQMSDSFSRGTSNGSDRGVVSEESVAVAE
jgi:hypothetical protein